MALNLIKKDKSHSVVSIKLDEQEFHNIFKEYYAALCSFAFQYMEDADMSADIVQDVFAKLWQIRDDFFYLHQVKAFLYTAVRNHALNELEHSKVAHEYEQKIIAKKADAFFRPRGNGQRLFDGFFKVRFGVFFHVHGDDVHERAVHRHFQLGGDICKADRVHGRGRRGGFTVFFQPVQIPGKAIDRHAQRFIERFAAGRQIVQIGENNRITAFFLKKTSGIS